MATLSSSGTGLLVILLGATAKPSLAILAVLVGALLAGFWARVWVGRPVEAVLEEVSSAAGIVEQRARNLEESLRGKDEFLTNTVHELRTPLTTMLASLDMLQDGYAVTPEDQTSFIDQAATATRHLSFLINDILDSAAFEAGKLRLDLRRCFVREITLDVERLMVPLARARELKLVIEHPTNDLAVIGDQGRILQVIFNLMSNALKFTPTHGTVVLRAITTEVGAVFEVEDEGVGVPMDARKDLFTRFNKLHSPEMPGVPGTGVGLHVSRMLVKLMNGSIGFRERRTGNGSVFWFTLPRAANTEQAPGTVDCPTECAQIHECTPVRGEPEQE